MLQTECAATNKSKFVDHHQSSSRSVAIAASATSSSAASTFVVNHSSSSSNILSSSVLQTKASSSSLTSNISKTYCNTTTNVVTRKRGGLAIAIKRQDSIDAYGSNYNNSGRNITPLSSRQSSYSVPPTPLTPTVPTLRRGISVREVEAATEICIGNGDNATNSRSTATQHRELSCLERFRENLYRRKSTT
ncbi:uncharacterized protein LOC129238166 [Anastrepha obliqua]|uniref:uncharacterized protein LOC129238166 n=1 Tax=Anastrepha obliqua TaxID=95512 RepID=UPI0024096E04|nr:uncharacterized protein LOC129238166 [Anastrepha obliqua]